MLFLRNLRLLLNCESQCFTLYISALFNLLKCGRNTHALYMYVYLLLPLSMNLNEIEWLCKLFKILKMTIKR